MDLNTYSNFVKEVTSAPSEEYGAFIDRINELEKEWNTPLLLTSCLGLSSESGEFTEIVKKIIFQGKPLTKENLFHMKRELGDILWYWVNACRSLGFNPNEVMQENVQKLLSRYPEGKFDSFFSENRQKNDL